MRKDAPKDLFVIHTKSTKPDGGIVDSLAALLLPRGFTVWGYADWKWQEQRAHEPTWQDALATRGFLEPEEEEEALNGPRVRFPPPVDHDKLDKILLRTRAVIFLNPSRGRLSDGMREELFSLRRLQRIRRLYENRAFPAPVCIWCTPEGETPDPYPLTSFGDGDVTWADSLETSFRDTNALARSCLTMGLSLAARLIEQRAAFVSQLTTVPRNTFLLTQTFCSADEELARCARVGAVASEYLRAETADKTIHHRAQALVSLLQRYTRADLDWARWQAWRA